MGDSEVPEQWARRSDVQELLAYMLAMPDIDHSSAVGALLAGKSLSNGMAVGLFRASNAIDFSKQKWAASRTRNKGVAYHTWLFTRQASAKQHSSKHRKKSASAAVSAPILHPRMMETTAAAAAGGCDARKSKPLACLLPWRK